MGEFVVGEGQVVEVVVGGWVIGVGEGGGDRGLLRRGEGRNVGTAPIGVGSRRGRGGNVKSKTRGKGKS